MQAVGSDADGVVRKSLRWPAALVGAVSTVLCVLVPWLRFRRLATPSWDNAIFQQAIAGYAHLHAPIADIKGPGFDVLGDHFSPIIAVIAPFYRLAPYAQTLFVAQAVLIGWSAWVITALAMRRLGAWPGAGFGMAYMLSFGIASAVAVDFHEVAFGAPFLACAGAAWVERRWRSLVGWCALLLLVKEDLALTVVAIGVVLVLTGTRRLGCWLVVGGVAAGLLIVFVLIPSANGSGEYLYLHGDANGGAIGLGVLAHGAGTKLRTLALTFGITGFAAFRSPWVLVAVPTLAWRFCTDKEFYWTTDWHYALVLMPVVFVAAIDGVERARGRRPERLRHVAGVVSMALVVIAWAVAWSFPFGELRQRATWRASPRLPAAQAVISRIPAGASVETDIGLITHLVGEDRTVYWVGTVGKAVPDFVLIDAEGGGWSSTPPDAATYAEQQHPGTRYRVVLDRDGYQLARRAR